MGRMKANFEYWQDNVASYEELQLPILKQMELASEWQTEYYEWLTEKEGIHERENYKNRI